MDRSWDHQKIHSTTESCIQHGWYLFNWNADVIRMCSPKWSPDRFPTLTLQSTEYFSLKLTNAFSIIVEWLAEFEIITMQFHTHIRKVNNSCWACWARFYLCSGKDTRRIRIPYYSSPHYQPIWKRNAFSHSYWRSSLTIAPYSLAWLFKHTSKTFIWFPPRTTLFMSLNKIMKGTTTTTIIGKQTATRSQTKFSIEVPETTTAKDLTQLRIWKMKTTNVDQTRKRQIIYSYIKRIAAI